jgi:hypothetical protein
VGLLFDQGNGGQAGSVPAGLHKPDIGMPDRGGGDVVTPIIITPGNDVVIPPTVTLPPGGPGPSISVPAGQPPPVGPPGFIESFIPVWGSGRSALNDFETGHWGWGTFNAGVALSDVFLVKAMATGLAKGSWKLGSHTWSATRAWYGTTRGLAPRTPVHHWLIEQGSSVGRHVPDVIKNQPYNLMPLADQALHIEVHQSAGFRRVWYGTPGWAKALWFSTTGRGVDAAEDVLE